MFRKGRKKNWIRQMKRTWFEQNAGTCEMQFMIYFNTKIFATKIIAWVSWKIYSGLERFSNITGEAEILSDNILKITGSHPYYIRQLAFTVWELLKTTGFQSGVVEMAADEIIQNHDNDYERLWHTFNRTDMLVLTGMTLSDLSMLSEEFRKQFGEAAPGTVFSNLQCQPNRGILIKEGSSCQMGDPFFRRWIIKRKQL